MKIIIDADKCDGCRTCELICCFFHLQEFNPRRARIKVEKNVREGVYTPGTCNQCQECISSCSLEAISWDEGIGVIRVDAETCNGCGICVETCPLGVIWLDPITEKANICDLCNGDPQCVKWCPEPALRLEGVSVS